MKGGGKNEGAFHPHFSRLPRFLSPSRITLATQAKEISSAGRVEIVPSCETRQAYLEIKYKEVVIVQVKDPTVDLDVLWKTSRGSTHLVHA